MVGGGYVCLFVCPIGACNYLGGGGGGGGGAGKAISNNKITSTCKKQVRTCEKQLRDCKKNSLGPVKNNFDL